MVPCPTVQAEDSTRANLQMGPMGVHSKEARFHTQRVAGLKVLEVAHVGVGEMILWENDQDKRELDQWFECVTALPRVFLCVGIDACARNRHTYSLRAATPAPITQVSASVAQLPSPGHDSHPTDSLPRRRGASVYPPGGGLC